ncbi:Ubiquinone/menaquinone biosynthesis C-methyltransferase UbiE [bacterium HR07]|uniref:Methyltransferase type 11 n=1 Tax=Acetithermum autotrophicum TaxID=1446466 RepID=H5SV03_ACEAU|nr:methyltransferase type 11 [Candidatus Acetothermum autotrophicum]GBC75975.1 Ubiquinone/menaquinone biosynthesis C-methyltransferase UbiE [bacterium HR07]
MHAVIYDGAMWPAEKFLLSQLRRRLVGTAHGRVLELGIGTGANLPYYPSTVELVGIDPNEDFLKRARRRAVTLGRSVTLLAACAEELPFAEHSFDMVIATLVFCTVTDPQRALSEVHRVLKPGGAFRVLEHVRVRSFWGAKVQDILTPLWRRVANNCHLNRDTLSLVQAHGFLIESVREHMGGLVIEVEARSQ